MYGDRKGGNGSLRIQKIGGMANGVRKLRCRCRSGLGGSRGSLRGGETTIGMLSETSNWS